MQRKKRQGEEGEQGPTHRVNPREKHSAWQTWDTNTEQMSSKARSGEEARLYLMNRCVLSQFVWESVTADTSGITLSGHKLHEELHQTKGMPRQSRVNGLCG